MRNELLFFADSYTYLLYYYRLFIVSYIEDFSTMNRGVFFYINPSNGGILVLSKVIPNLFRNLLMRPRNKFGVTDICSGGLILVQGD